METQFVGGTTFNAATGEVRRDGSIARLEPQPALVLNLLIRHAGEVVTHDALRLAIWGGDTHVDFQDGVHYCVRQIRAALGEQARAARVITTIPKRGYRLNADALIGPQVSKAIASDSSPAARPAVAGVVVEMRGWRRRLAVIGLLGGLGLATAIVERRPNTHHDTAVAVVKALHDFIY